MLSVDEARNVVREAVRPLEGHETVPLSAALGRVLAAPLCAGRDDPPFERALMDGWAVRAADVDAAPVDLRVVGRVAAGDARLPEIGAGEGAWINTGAPLPPGADAVVPVEDSRGEVSILRAVARGANVLPRAELVHAGEVVADGVLHAESIAVCAAQGHDPVEVRRRPCVAVLATGSELRADPGAHEIRNSNGPLLSALLLGAGLEVRDLGVAPDDADSLREALRRGLGADVLLTTGGISKGDRDFVRPTLEELGVDIAFHGVALQPGKPLLFGRHPGGFVFGLPGNPASTLVCADLFVLPALAALSGRPFDAVLAERRVRTTAPIRSSAQRRRVFPCVVRGGRVDPLPWRSSADLYTLARANGYLVVEPGRDLAAGEETRALVPERFAATAEDR